MQKKYVSFLLIVLAIILAIIFLYMSKWYVTAGGEVSVSGFPLYYQTNFSWMPVCSQEPCTASSRFGQIDYNNLIIDFIFWLFISCLLVFGFKLFSKKIKSKNNR